LFTNRSITEVIPVNSRDMSHATNWWDGLPEDLQADIECDG